MRSSTKSELQMLREVAWLILPTINCLFCRKPLVDGTLVNTFGHRRHPSIVEAITVHHKDHTRDNNFRGGIDSVTPGGLSGNLGLAHSRCHRSYHANLRRQHDQDDDTNR